MSVSRTLEQDLTEFKEVKDQFAKCEKNYQDYYKQRTGPLVNVHAQSEAKNAKNLLNNSLNQFYDLTQKYANDGNVIVKELLALNNIAFAVQDSVGVPQNGEVILSTIRKNIYEVDAAHPQEQDDLKLMIPPTQPSRARGYTPSSRTTPSSNSPSYSPLFQPVQPVQPVRSYSYPQSNPKLNPARR